jgi:hypothetical protein
LNPDPLAQYFSPLANQLPPSLTGVSAE